jgi:hypothetical protein
VKFSVNGMPTPMPMPISEGIYQKQKYIEDRKTRTIGKRIIGKNNT